MAIPSSPGSPSLLVGRNRELAVLREHLDATVAGRGSLVLVGRCYDLTETPPYGPWVDLFGRYRPADARPPLPSAFAERGTIGATTSQAALFHNVQDFLTGLAAQCPLILLLDDLHWADPASLDLVRFLGRSVTESALLILATYRSDEVTRHHPLYQLLPVLEREARATRLNLRRLSQQAVRSLLTRRYPLADRDTDRLIAFLLARAEGNIFFTLQLLRALEEAEVLHLIGHAWAVGDLDGVRLPMAVRQVLDGRLNRLDAESQRLLAVAAVIGQEVAFAVWTAAVGEDEATVLDAVEQAMTAHLVEVTADATGFRFVHALIREALYEGILPMRRWAIHRQVGDLLAVLADPDPDAVASHFQRAGDDRAVEWLVKAGDRAQRAWAWPTAMERYEAARALLEGSGATEAERGWLYFRLARVSKFYNTQRGRAYLDEARRLAVASEDRILAAISLYEHGALRVLQGDIRRAHTEIEESLTAFGSLSPAERSRVETLRSIGVTDEQFVRGSLFESLINAGRYAEARALESLTFAQRARGARPGPESAATAYVYRGLGRLHASLGRAEEARRAYTSARAGLCAEGNDLEAGLTALDELRYVALVYRADDVAERRALAAEAERLYQRSRSHQTRIPSQRGRLPLMIVEGDWSEARAVGEAVIAVGGYGGYLSHAQSELGPLAHAQGDTQLARRLVKDALPAGLATVPGETSRFAASLVMQRLAAILAIDAGDPVTARQWLDAHDHWLAWSGAIHGRSEGQALWAQYYWQNGAVDQAETHARQALAHASDPQQPLALLAAHRLLGELETNAGRIAQAGSHLDAALALADACAAPYERALTLLARAELCRVTGNAADALALLDEVRALCLPLGAKPALARVDALVARISTANDAPPISPAGLSPREVDVLRLIAVGQTNREIAESLSISVKTVVNHVTHILTKTHLRNRAEAVAFALQHDLGAR